MTKPNINLIFRSLNTQMSGTRDVVSSQKAKTNFFVFIGRGDELLYVTLEQGQ